MPCWEEVLLFNEIFSYILSRQETDPKVIMFFEVRYGLSERITIFHLAKKGKQNQTKSDLGEFSAVG